MSPEVKQKLAAARRAYEQASKELSKVTAQCYRVGQTVAVDLGRARVIGKVTAGFGYWWSDPDRVTIENIKTGKSRHFGGSAIDIYHPELLQT